MFNSFLLVIQRLNMMRAGRWHPQNPCFLSRTSPWTMWWDSNCKTCPSIGPGKASHFFHMTSMAEAVTLWWTFTVCNGKIHHAIFMRKSTISTGPCSIAMLVHQRVRKRIHCFRICYFDSQCWMILEVSEHVIGQMMINREFVFPTCSGPNRYQSYWNLRIFLFDFFEVPAAQNSNSVVPLGLVSYQRMCGLPPKEGLSTSGGKPGEAGAVSEMPGLDWTWCSPSLRGEHLVVLMPGMRFSGNNP